MAAIGPARWARSDSGDTVGPMPGLGGRATTWVAAGDDVGPTWRRAAVNSCAKSEHVGYRAAGSLASARRMQ